MGSDQVEWLGGQLSMDGEFYKSTTVRVQCIMRRFSCKGSLCKEFMVQ